MKYYKMKNLFSFLKQDIWCYTLLFFGFLLRLSYIFTFTKPESYLWSDAGYYDLMGLQMAKNQFVMFSTYWPPFFHIFLSFIYRPLIWLGLEAWRIKIDVILFALLYIVGFWCIYKITEKLFTKKIGLIVLGILTLWYPLVFLNYLVMSENLFFPLVFLGLYFLIVKPLKPPTGVWLGLTWGAAFLCRPIFALVFPLFFFWALFYKINWKLILNLILTTAVIVGSMMAFNSYYTKGAEKSISSNAGVGFAMLWCDAKSIEFNAKGSNFGFGPPANIDYPDSKRIFTAVPFENQKYYYQMGINCLRNNPDRLLNNFSSVIKLFNSHLFPTTSDVPGWNIFRLIFKILTGLLFIGSATTIAGLLTGFIKVDASIKKYFYLFGLIILSVLLTVYLQNIGEERYLMPYAPLLIIICIPLFSLFLNRIYPVKISDLYSLRPYWIWPIYLVLIVLSTFIFWISSISVKSGYLVLSDSFKIPINLPFQREDPNFKDPNPVYEIVIDSKINQPTKINIAIDDTIDEITLNNNSFNIEPAKKIYGKSSLDNWRPGYNFILPLKAGSNTLKIKSANPICCGSGIKLAQKPFFWIWILLFISIGSPLSHMYVLLSELLFKKNTDGKRN